MNLSWAQTVYEFDKRNAEICREMQIIGFKMDQEKAEKLSNELLNREDEARAKCISVLGYDMNPFSTKDLRYAITKHFGAPIYFRSTATKNPLFHKEALRGYAAARNEELKEFALNVLIARNARALRKTCITKPLSEIGDDGRIHPSWLNYGAVSGRFACHRPNLMNLPRHGSDPTSHLGGIRSLYVAPDGYELVYLDAKQIEMRVAAYLSNDPNMIRACEETDIHTANARVIFGAAAYDALEKWEKDTLRTMAKSAGFAVCYLAEADTVFARLISDGVKVSLRQVEALLSKLRRAFEKYYAYQRDRLLDAIRNGYIETPILGRRRQVGHTPGAPECANYPIQGGASEVVGIAMQKILDELEKKRYRSWKAALLAQVHDSLTFQVVKGVGAELGEICKKAFDSKIQIGQNYASFPIDLKIVQAWC